ncbi:MAG: DUF6036 family nucleotidyltransferase [Chthoniobacterales bacterium]
MTKEKEFVVIGSQAILAKFPNPPRILTRSIEADIYPLNAPEKSDAIDGAIGEMSQFHETFGYYAHGVAPETAVLPSKWKERVVKLLVSSHEDNITAHCLHPLDVAYSKLAAGREKDTEYIREMVRCDLIKAGALTNLIEDETEDKSRLDILKMRLQIVQQLKK